MRIVIDYRPALRARTGAGYYVFHLVQALIAQETLRRAKPAETPGEAALDALTLFSSSWKDRPLASDIDSLRSPAATRDAGAEAGRPVPFLRVVDRRVPVQMLNLLWHRLQWPPVEMLAGSTFDVAFSPHPLLLPSRHAAQVVTIHDLDFLTNPERSVREIRRDYPRLVRQHAHRAAHIIVPSHYTARQVESELGVSASRMTVCYPGAPEWATPEAAVARRHVLFLGTLEARKNVGALLGAYAGLVERVAGAPPLVLAGRAGVGSQPWLEQIRHSPLSGKVDYRGYVTDAERRQLFAEALAFVFPSLDEGFGIPVVEAMAAGVPVVVSNRGALPEVVGDAGLLVDADDPEALSAAIERMVTDEGLRAACTARGLLQAKRFRWSETARSAMSAFAQAMQQTEQ